MSFDPSNSAIKVTASLEEQISQASSQAEVQAILREHAKAQGVVTPDAYDPNILHEVESAQPLSKTVTINGVTHTMSGSEDSIRQQEIEIYRQALSGQQPSTEQPRDDAGRFVPNLDNYQAIAEAELVNRALANQGIDPEALREFSDNRQSQSWAQATASFREAHPDWMGGDQNTKTIGELIVNCREAMAGKTPLECLELAYAHAVEHGLLVETEEVAQYHRLKDAKTPAEIQAALGRNSTSGSSGYFGH